MDKTRPSTNAAFHESALDDSISDMAFCWAMRGLFQRYQMTFTALFCFQILVADKTVGVVRMDEFFQLLCCPVLWQWRIMLLNG
jgi:hypothetical protein